MKKIQLYILLSLFAVACNNSKKDETKSDTTLLIEEPSQPESDKTKVIAEPDSMVTPVE